MPKSLAVPQLQARLTDEANGAVVQRARGRVDTSFGDPRLKQYQNANRRRGYVGGT